MRKILIAAILGGSVIMAWNTVSHLVLHLGDLGIDVLAEEEAVVSTLREHVNDPGFYFFPGLDMSGDVSAEEQARWEESYRRGPSGVLIYRPSGGDPMPVSSMGKEWMSNILAALVAAWVLAHVPASYWRRVAVITGLGVVAWLTISASNWIWWGYPASFVAAEGVDTIVGWFLAGLAIAAVIRPQPVDVTHAAV